MSLPPAPLPRPGLRSIAAAVVAIGLERHPTGRATGGEPVDAP